MIHKQLRKVQGDHREKNYDKEGTHKRQKQTWRKQNKISATKTTTTTTKY